MARDGLRFVAPTDRRQDQAKHGVIEVLNGNLQGLRDGGLGDFLVAGRSEHLREQNAARARGYEDDGKP